jgi:tetratricopeptide (TPR) repeat protein
MFGSRVGEDCLTAKYGYDNILRKTQKKFKQETHLGKIGKMYNSKKEQTYELTGLDQGEKHSEKILSSIDSSYCNLSPEAQQLLLCLAPFTSVIFRNGPSQYAEFLKQQLALADFPLEKLPEALQEARRGGLLSPDPEVPLFLRLQPAFSDFLRQRLASHPMREVLQAAIEKAFHEYYSVVSRELYGLMRSKQGEEQFAGFLMARYECENMLTALRLAANAKAFVFLLYGTLSYYLDQQKDYARLQAIDTLMLDTLDKMVLEDLSEERKEDWTTMLGPLGNRQLRFKHYEAAKDASQKTLQILEIATFSDRRERRMLQASCYHQLGFIAHEQRQWEQAEKSYQQTLQIMIEFNNRSTQASIYSELGLVAEKQRHWEQALNYYRQALQLEIEFGDRSTLAHTYHRLSRVAQELGLAEQAETSYQQALQIFTEYSDGRAEAGTAYHLANIAQELGHWERAEKHSQQALQTYLKSGDRSAQARTYYQLGKIAQERGQWEQAENSYQQALQIKIEFNDRYDQASIFHQLGMVAQEQRQWEQAEKHFLEALDIWTEYNDDENSGIALKSLARLWKVAKRTDLVTQVASILESTPEAIEERFCEILVQERP